MVSEILAFFIFQKNSGWPPKIVKVENFDIFSKSLFFHPSGQKFARNRSISYGVRDICNFSFSAKIQDGRPKL